MNTNVLGIGNSKQSTITLI